MRNTKYFQRWPVVCLEIIRSKSGLSTSVYCNGDKLFSFNGCGYDVWGDALDRWFHAVYDMETSISSHNPDSVPGFDISGHTLKNGQLFVIRKIGA